MIKKTILIPLIIMMIFIGTFLIVKKEDVIKSGNELSIFITTDIHYVSRNLTDYGTAFDKYVNSSDGRHIVYIDEIVSAFSHDINRDKPDIVIISGDLTNNGEKEGHLDLSKKLKSMERDGTKVYVIPGNHDINNPWAVKFQGDETRKTESISPEDFKEIYQDFGYREAISKDNHSLSYLAKPSQDLWLLMLDTVKYSEIFGIATGEGEISEETMKWIEKCSQLAKEQGARILTVMHHNLYNHSDILNKGYTLNNSEEILKLMKENDLNLTLSGHVHIQDIKSNQEQNPIYDIATSSLALNPVQYGVLKYKPKVGYEYLVQEVDVEGWAKKEKLEDENLLHFSQYSKKQFENRSYAMAIEQLMSMGGHTEEDMKLMATTMSELNSYYFSGNVNSIRENIIHSRGYSLWQNLEPNFLKEYVLSMSTKLSDDRSLIINFE